MQNLINSKRMKTAAILVLVSVSVYVRPVSALTLPASFAKTWNGSSGTAWGTPANWTSSTGFPGVPSSLDSVHVPSTSNRPSITAASSANILVLGNNASLTQSSGTLTVSQYFQVGWGSPATYSISGGTLNVNGSFFNITGAVVTQTGGTVNVNSGTLSVGAEVLISGSTTIWPVSATYMLKGGSLSFNQLKIGNSTYLNSAQFIYENATSFSQGSSRRITLTNGGTFNMANTGSVITLNNPFTIDGSYGTIRVAFEDMNFTVSGQITATAAGTELRKTGLGTLTLAGSNTFTNTGGVFVSQGVLRLANQYALGSLSRNEVDLNATLDLNGQTISAAVWINGNGTSGQGVIINGSTTEAHWNSNIALYGDSTIGGSGDITIAGPINGHSPSSSYTLTKSGTCTLTLSSHLSGYSGTTNVNAGTL
ncbi:MAG: autotransporter-associated beta strand repeat-containing protein, partial [Phycisphaerales bacterium]|nr:autotransporter-associated beta strand repeat-containing protein [Phycisphaerales bacterium]